MTEESRAPIAVLIVNYASSSLIEQNIVPLTRARPDLLVIVADNWTTATERAAVQTLATGEGWAAVLQDENSGFGAAMNAAAAVAIDQGAAALLLLNPDATIEPAALDLLAAGLTDRALVAPTITRSDGTFWFRGSDLSRRDGRVWGRPRRPAGADVMEWLTGACLLISTELWQEIGGFEEAYFLYWEDVDLSWKVHDAGGAVRLVPEAVAVHDAGGTQGASHSSREPKSDIYYYFNIRNRMVFAALRLGAAERRRWWLHTPVVVFEVLRTGGGRHLIKSLRPWRAGALGVLDGWSMGRSIVRGRPIRSPRTEQRARRGTSPPSALH